MNRCLVQKPVASSCSCRDERRASLLPPPLAPSSISSKAAGHHRAELSQQPDCLSELPAPREQQPRPFLAETCPVPQGRSFPDAPFKGNAGTAQRHTPGSHIWARGAEPWATSRAEAEGFGLHAERCRPGLGAAIQEPPSVKKPRRADFVKRHFLWEERT